MLSLLFHEKMFLYRELLLIYQHLLIFTKKKRIHQSWPFNYITSVICLWFWSHWLIFAAHKVWSLEPLSSSLALGRRLQCAGCSAGCWSCLWILVGWDPTSGLEKDWKVSSSSQKHSCKCSAKLLQDSWVHMLWVWGISIKSAGVMN